jgi:hypothetical protein
MVYCFGTLTFESAGTCPLPSAQAVAWFFVGVTSFISVGGVVLFWLRRHRPLVSKRDWVTTSTFVVLTILSLVSVLFDRAMPCWAYFALNYFISALIPGTLLARFWGVYARHVRQAEAVQGLGAETPPRRERQEAKGVNDASSPASSTRAPEETPRREAPAAAKPSIVVLFWIRHTTFVEHCVLRFGIDKPRRSALISLVTCVPYLVYFLVRLAVSPSHISVDPGCIFDTADVVVSGIISFGSVGTAFSALLSLARMRDALFQRFEVLSQLVIWPPAVAWLLYDLSRPEGQHLTSLKGLYGIVIGCLLTLVVILWLPALASYSRGQEYKDTGAPQLHRRPGESCDDMTEVSLPRQKSQRGTLHIPHVEADSNPQKNVLPSSVAFSSSMEDTITVVTVVTSAEASHSRIEHTGSQTAAMTSALIHSSDLRLMVDTAARFVLPAPAAAEIIATLETPVAMLLSNERSTCIFGAALLATASGRELLNDTLQLCMSAELLGFLVGAVTVRQKAEAYLKSIAAATPASDGSEGYARRLSRFVETLARFVSRYVVADAPHYVNIGREALTLQSALQSLSRRRSMSMTAAEPDIVQGALLALTHAEADVFEMVTFEPLRWRMRREARVFAAWSTSVLVNRSAAPPTMQPPQPKSSVVTNRMTSVSLALPHGLHCPSVGLPYEVAEEDLEHET